MAFFEKLHLSKHAKTISIIPMKKFLLLLLVTSLSFSTSGLGDIQDPPKNKQGPTRKLARGVANLLFGVSEIPYQVAVVNSTEGNNTAATQGVARGVSKAVTRMGVGLYEILTFPFPIHRKTYEAPYETEFISRHRGFSEFPPDLGSKTRYDYSRDYNAGP